jgi:hypothetical protein
VVVPAKASRLKAAPNHSYGLVGDFAFRRRPASFEIYIQSIAGGGKRVKQNLRMKEKKTGRPGPPRIVAIPAMPKNKT